MKELMNLRDSLSGLTAHRSRMKSVLIDIDAVMSSPFYTTCELPPSLVRFRDDISTELFSDDGDDDALTLHRTGFRRLMSAIPYTAGTVLEWRKDFHSLIGRVSRMDNHIVSGWASETYTHSLDDFILNATDALRILVMVGMFSAVFFERNPDKEELLKFDSLIGCFMTRDLLGTMTHIAPFMPILSRHNMCMDFN